MKDKVKLWHRNMMLLAVIIGFIAPMTMSQAQAKATQRPIEEFVEAQGTFCLSNDFSFGVYEDPCPANTGFLFVDPVKNFMGWSDPEQNRSASIDYAGLADSFLGNTLGTTFHGSITERTLADGRAEIIVNLKTQNALTWIIEGGDFGNGPLLFGHRAPDVSEENAALCDSHLQVKFINSAPEALLPDLLQLLFFPEEGQETLSIAMRCNAEGPLREGFDSVEDGTQGRAVVTQTGLFMPPAFKPDGSFPVERIDLKVIGKKAKD